MVRRTIAIASRSIHCRCRACLARTAKTRARIAYQSVKRSASTRIPQPFKHAITHQDSAEVIYLILKEALADKWFRNRLRLMGYGWWYDFKQTEKLLAGYRHPLRPGKLRMPLVDSLVHYCVRSSPVAAGEIMAGAVTDQLDLRDDPFNARDYHPGTMQSDSRVCNALRDKLYLAFKRNSRT